MTKTNVCTKSSELVSILNTQFQGKINLARIKLISHFVIALCKVQTVTFEKLANSFDSSSTADSSLRRIQRFIATYYFDSDLVARLIFSLIPDNKTVRITMDRTNWKFGKLDINIFMLGVVYQGVAFPLLFKMLPKRGNSNTNERIELVNRFINLFGKETIESIVADREFVGKNWINYLNENDLKYYIRIRNNFKVFNFDKNKETPAFWLFNDLKVNQFRYCSKIVSINGELCYLSGMKLPRSGKKQEFLIIVSFTKPEKAQEYYKQRWQIEMCFKAMKTSGFNIEKTHLTDIDRIEKLVLLIMIAFVWSYKIGIYLHTKIKEIPIKTHGRKAKSIFKHGLNFLNKFFLSSEKELLINVFGFLSCT